VRAKTGLLTAGFANPVVSTGETAGAIGVSIAAIVVPLLCLLALVVLFIWIGRKMRRMMWREGIEEKSSA
jgi:flagellar biogenesis protein FliO